MKLIITGATGMVGSEVLRQAIADNDIESITIIVRRATDITHPKLKTILHQNFLDYSNLTDAFKNNDAVIWCLGISQNVVSKKEYIKITFDYTIAFAENILQANPGISFLFLSGRGVDNTKKSCIYFKIAICYGKNIFIHHTLICYKFRCSCKSIIIHGKKSI